MIHLALRKTLALLLFSLASSALYAQQTVLNVPSADVLAKGQTYMELDLTVGDGVPSVVAVPRNVTGVGHNMEAGVNTLSFGIPGTGAATIVPTIKWKFYENQTHGVALFTGAMVFLPTCHDTYKIGDSVYLEAAKTFRTRTRIGLGVYDFTANVMDKANRAGVQASIEQTITTRWSVAADWYSGNHTVGYLTSGVVYKATSQVTVYGAFEMGNHNLFVGNHSALLIVGWNPVLRRRQPR